MPEVSDEVIGLVLALALARVVLRRPWRGGTWAAHASPRDDLAGLRRMRTDLHDLTFQRLAALAWRTEQIPGTEWTAVAAEVWAILDELRAIVLDGDGPVPDRVDLLLALRTLVDERRESVPVTHLVILDRTDGLPPGIPDEVTAQAVRVAAEAIGNAVRHGDATTVTVEASLGEGRLHLEVRDDGSGIDPDRMAHARTHGHAGLRAMQERAAAMGARLAIESGARGTRVTLDWRR